MPQLALGKLKYKQAELPQALDGALDSSNHPELLKAWELIQTIPGVGNIVDEVVIAEIGVNLREFFPSTEHLASWAGICPGNKGSGGQAAWAATHTKQKTYLSAMYRRLVRRMGKKKALVAAAHALAVMIYHMVDRSKPYIELGADYFQRTQPEKQMRYHVKRLEAMGFKVTLEKTTGAA